MSAVINKPSVVFTGAGSPTSLVILTDGHSPSGVASGGDANLIVADAAALTGGTILLSVPQAALVRGAAIPLVAVTSGLAIQQCPPGVSVQILP
jgi:hypothetical protein